MIPKHLQKLPSKRQTYFGTLTPKIDNDGNVTFWIIEGDPNVIQFAKRLFPGSEGRGAGYAKFPNTKRIIEDLNWLMLRYPLKIKDRSVYDRAYNESVKHALRIIQFNKRMSKLEEPAEFVGELKDFQKEGLSFLVGAERALLADDMGLGKTPQALAAIAALKAYPALIVPPPHLVINWKKEIKKFINLPAVDDDEQLCVFDKPKDHTVHVIKGLKPYELPPANIYIIHYGLLRGWKHALLDYDFKAIVFDEIQELRHTGTEKYSAASLISGKVPYCFGLSGTPIYNYGAEMWSVMNIIEYHCLGDYDSFTREWCVGYGERLVKDPERLGAYLKREGLMLRRRKAEVSKELPPKRRVVQTIDFEEGTYSKLIQEAVDIAKSIESTKDYFEKGRLTREVVDRSRRAIGIAKAPFVAAFIKMLLDSGERVLIGAYHHDVWDIYRKELKAYNPVFITGKETAAQKDASVEAFKNGKTNLCCISLRAAAGIDGLQSATVVACGELDWSPAIHSQFEDRVQRIGVDTTQDSILCYYLVAEEGTDEVMQEFLGLKVSQFVGLMGDKSETEEDKAIAQAVASEHMKKVVEKLKERGKMKGEQSV